MMIIKSPFIRGWKGLAEYTGYHERTLRRWHYERCPLPFIKAKITKYSRWVITADRVAIWMKICGADPKSLNNAMSIITSQ